MLNRYFINSTLFLNNHGNTMLAFKATKKKKQKKKTKKKQVYNIKICVIYPQIKHISSDNSIFWKYMKQPSDSYRELSVGLH